MPKQKNDNQVLVDKIMELAETKSRKKRTRKPMTDEQKQKNLANLEKARQVLRQRKENKLKEQEKPKPKIKKKTLDEVMEKPKPKVSFQEPEEEEVEIVEPPKEEPTVHVEPITESNLKMTIDKIEAPQTEVKPEVKPESESQSAMKEQAEVIIKKEEARKEVKVEAIKAKSIPAPKPIERPPMIKTGNLIETNRRYNHKNFNPFA